MSVCRLFQRYIAKGDLDLVLSLYDDEASGTEPIIVYAIEVARCQPDGIWSWLIGDPYTVGRNVSASRKGPLKHTEDPR